MSTGNEISKGVSATDYEQQVKRLKRNLFDCQEAAKDLAQQATKAEAERDAMAAKLKELEGQAERYKVLLSNSDHTQPMNSRMLAALRRIERWFGEFPPTGQQWDDGSPMSYFACYGSNGERDYMRSVARDAIAAAEAQQAELEGQEPVTSVEHRYNADGLSCHITEYLPEGLPLFARPIPADPANVEFGMHGKNMFFKIGNQSFLLDYKPAEPGEFEFMQKMLLSAFSSITPCVKTASEPVNARLLDVAVWPAGYCRDPNGKMSIPAGKEEDFNFGYDVGFQEAWEILNSAISAAGKSPTSQQERLLQDMHDAGREIDRVMAEAAPKAVRLTDYSSTVDRAWARFCGAFGDGPDAPYPGMIAAFETHYGQSFRDKEWRTEAACWAAAWSKATARADAKNDSCRLDALEAVAKASGTGVSFDWCRHVEDGMVVEHGYRMMWKHTIGPREKSIRHAIDAAMGEFKP